VTKNRDGELTRRYASGGVTRGIRGWGEVDAHVSSRFCILKITDWEIGDHREYNIIGETREVSLRDLMAYATPAEKEIEYLPTVKWPAHCS